MTATPHTAGAPPPPLRPDLTEHLAAICADLGERGIRPSALNVIAYATDTGLSEEVAVALAGMIEDQP